MTRQKLKVVKSAPEADTKELFLAKLEESGLTAEDAEQLGMTYIEAEETESYGKNFIPCAALKIPYYDLAGQPATDTPHGEDYFRVRFLGNYEKIFEQRNGGVPGKRKKPPKYMQKANTLPMVYFPRFRY